MDMIKTTSTSNLLKKSGTSDPVSPRRSKVSLVTQAYAFFHRLSDRLIFDTFKKSYDTVKKSCGTVNRAIIKAVPAPISNLAYRCKLVLLLELHYNLQNFTMFIDIPIAYGIDSSFFKYAVEYNTLDTLGKMANQDDYSSQKTYNDLAWSKSHYVIFDTFFSGYRILSAVFACFYSVRLWDTAAEDSLKNKGVKKTA